MQLTRVLFFSPTPPSDKELEDAECVVTPPEERNRTVEERLDALEKRVRYINERLQIIQRAEGDG